jgi:hypothetical protein
MRMRLSPSCRWPAVGQNVHGGGSSEAWQPSNACVNEKCCKQTRTNNTLLSEIIQERVGFESYWNQSVQEPLGQYSQRIRSP